MVAEAGVGPRVRHDGRLLVGEGVAAEREGAWRLREGDPVARLEPLAVPVEERDEREGRAHDAGREAVEGLLGRAVQDAVPADGCEAGLLVERSRGEHGAGAGHSSGRRRTGGERALRRRRCHVEAEGFYLAPGVRSAGGEDARGGGDLGHPGGGLFCEVGHLSHGA